MWQELRSQLRPLGLEIVTVAMDTAGPDAARPFVELAKSQHPSLIDTTHVLGALFGVVNVPNGIWIDESGMIVRPVEPAFPGRSPIFESLRNPPASATDGGSLVNMVRGSSTPLSPAIAERLELTKQIVIEAELYRDMLVDWATNGAASQYVLSPDEVIARSAPRSEDASKAAAHFELGEHYHRGGQPEAAVSHWKEAHRLQPDNWTYKRQAWRLDPQAGTGVSSYEGDWSTDVRAIGAENYYPRIQP